MKKHMTRFWVMSFLLLLVISISLSQQVLPVQANSLTLILDPETAQVGDIVAVMGSQATPNSEIRLYFQRLMLTSTISDDEGNFSAQFAVPRVGGGNCTLIARDIGSDTGAVAYLVVRPRIQVMPNFDSFDDRVSVEGEGFTPHVAITLRIGETNVTSTSIIYTDFLGVFATDFRMLQMPAGIYNFSASDTSGNSASEPITVKPKITVQPTSDDPNTFASILGHGFSGGDQITLFFDSNDVTADLPIFTSREGSFFMPFLVPDVPDGVHSITAYDNTGNNASTIFVVPSPIIRVAPETVFEPSMIKVEGLGFQPYSPMVIYLKDTSTGDMCNVMAKNENVLPSLDGSFQYSFILPVTHAGLYKITACKILGPLPSDLQELASAELTIMKHESLEVEVTTGTLHFRGELAEFYIKTTLNGEFVDAQIDGAQLYSANATFKEDLSQLVTEVSTGYYRIPYAIPSDASFGTYALLVNISLHKDFTQAFGSATGSFTISNFFTTEAAQLLDIQNNIATAIIPELGTVRANLSAIDARLQDIQGNVVIIQSDIGTFQSCLEELNASLVSINGTVATIESDIGTLEVNFESINATLVGMEGETVTINSELGTLRTSADSIHAEVTSIENGVATVSSDIGTMKTRLAETGTQTSGAVLAAAAAAVAAAATLSIVIYKRRPPKTPTNAPTYPPTDEPPTEKEPTPVQSTKEEKAEPQQTQTEPLETGEGKVESPQEETPPKEDQNSPNPPSPEPLAPTEPPPSAQQDHQTQPSLVVLPQEAPVTSTGSESGKPSGTA